MGNTELNLFRLKQNWNSSTKKKKPGKRFPSFLFSSSTGCSKLHHHWQCSPPALCRSAKRQRGDLCHLLLSFLPRFFTLPAGISPLPPITPQTEVPSSHCLLQLNIKPSPWEGSLELHFDDPPGCLPAQDVPRFCGSEPSWEKPQSEVMLQPTAADNQQNKESATWTQLFPGAAFPPQHREGTGQCACATGLYLSHEGSFCTQACVSTVPSPAQTKRSFSIMPTTLKRQKILQ